MLRVESLQSSVQAQALLKGLSFELEPGQVHCLLGPSGSGKSTLLKVLMGLFPFERGTISWSGEILALEGNWKRECHELPMRGLLQDAPLFDHLNVLGNLELAQPRGWNVELRRRLGELLELLHIEQLLDRRVDGLSGGERQRIALARCLISSEQVALLDEPFSNVDALHKESILPQLRSWLRERKMTVLLASHDRQEAYAMGDRWMVLRSGELLQTGSPEELYRRPVDLWCARFGGAVNELSEEDWGCLGAASQSRSWCRPEELRIKAKGEQVNATLLETRFCGPVQRLSFRLDTGRELWVERPSSSHAIKEDRVRLEVLRPEGERL